MNFDWQAIQARYEAGESPGQISRTLGGRPSRQAIHKRAKAEGWQRQQMPVNGRQSSTEAVPADVMESLSFDQKTVILEIASGATQREAAGLAQIDESTISQWKKRTPEFVKAFHYAEAVKKQRRRLMVEHSPDPKDARWLLERDPGSRDEYAAPQAGNRNLFAGNVFNVLAGVDLEIPRGENPLDANSKLTNGRTLEHEQ